MLARKRAIAQKSLPRARAFAEPKERDRAQQLRACRFEGIERPAGGAESGDHAVGAFRFVVGKGQIDSIYRRRQLAKRRFVERQRFGAAAGFLEHARKVTASQVARGAPFGRRQAARLRDRTAGEIFGASHCSPSVR